MTSLTSAVFKVVAVLDRFQHRRGEVLGVEVRQRALAGFANAARGAGSVDDIGVGHGSGPFQLLIATVAGRVAVLQASSSARRRVLPVCRDPQLVSHKDTKRAAICPRQRLHPDTARLAGGLAAITTTFASLRETNRIRVSLLSTAQVGRTQIIHSIFWSVGSARKRSARLLTIWALRRRIASLPVVVNAKGKSPWRNRRCRRQSSSRQSCPRCGDARDSSHPHGSGAPVNALGKSSVSSRISMILQV